MQDPRCHERPIHLRHDRGITPPVLGEAMIVVSCGQVDPNDRDRWEYFFVGVGTVSRPVPRTESRKNLL